MESLPTRSVALIGAGYWGKNLARDLNKLGALHMVCDRSAEALAALGADYEGVRKSTEFSQVLADEAVSGVVVAAPAVQHYELAKAALLAGKDVLVEKPLCLRAREARELVEIADGARRVLMVGHLLQYHPCVRKLQSLLGQGQLGKLLYITSNRLNLGKIRREENALWSFAPHDLSVILTLAGSRVPELVQCTGEAYLTPGIADTTLAALKFTDGVRAHVFVSWLNPFKEQKLTVVGSNGMAVFDDTRPWPEKLIIYPQYLTWENGAIPTANKARGEAIEVTAAEPLLEECRHFLDCCLHRRTPRTDGWEALRVLQVLEAAQASLERDGQAVRPGEEAPPPATAHLAPARSNPDFFAHPTAVVDDGAQVGKGTKIWHFSHIMKGAVIGEKCVLGQNVNVDGGTQIGNNVKIQNNVSVYTGVTLEDDVFLGPSCVLTNVTNPRAQVNRHSLYEKTLIKRGATIGANSTIVCGLTIGRYAFVAAGAVVTRNVRDYALVAGNPARQKGWMSRHGHVLSFADGLEAVCPESRFRYQKSSGPDGDEVRCLSLRESAPLPSGLAKSERDYQSYKTGK